MYSISKFYRIIISQPVYPNKKNTIYKSIKYPFKPSVDMVQKIINELDYKMGKKDNLIIKIKKEYEVTKE